MRKLLQRLIFLAFVVIVGMILVWNKACTKEEYVLGGVAVVFSVIFLRHTRRQRLLNSTLRKIDQMDGVRFEEYLMHQFKKKGYQAKMTPLSGDFGADLILKKRRKKFVVQVKRYSGSVGIKAVQEIIGAKEYYGIQNGMVITNSYFTKAAKELAAASGIELWDRKVLMEQFCIESGYRD